MILKKVLPFVCLVEVLSISLASPVSFPTERSDSTDLSVDSKHAQQSLDNVDPEGRSYVAHQLKKKRKRQKVACLLALQQYNNRYRRAAPQLTDQRDGQGRTFFWGGLNVYDTDIHVYNGGYGNKPSFSPGGGGLQSSNPCQAFPVLSGLGNFGSLPSLPSLPNFPSVGNIGNEIIHVISPGSSSSSSGSSSSGSNGGSNGGGLGGSNGGGSNGGGLGGSNGGDSDGDNEDYDYSDGASSDNNGNRIKKRRKPTQSSSSGLLSNIRPDRYIDYYVFRPIDRTFRQLASWF